MQKQDQLSVIRQNAELSSPSAERPTEYVPSMVPSLTELDRSNVVDVDLGSAEFEANAHRHMAEWARRRPFYVLGNGPPQVIVGRYADVHRVFSETETFKSEMPRGPGWEQFNKVMFAQFVTQMDGEQHARVRRLLLPAFSSRRIEQLEVSITRIIDGMLDRIEANGPEFDGMQDYGAHLVVDALLDAMVNMDKRRKAMHGGTAIAACPELRSRRLS